MAFATLEDKSGSIEVVVFAKKYETYRRLIEVDMAVCVIGTVSRRDGERGKILLNSAAELLTDEEFKKRQPKIQQSNERSAYVKKSSDTAVAIRGSEARQRASVQPSHSADTKAPTREELMSAQVEIPKNVRVVYIKVPSRDSEIYKKCANIVEIMDGGVRVRFYFSDTKEYVDYHHGMDVCRGAVVELVRLAGADSIVLK